MKYKFLNLLKSFLLFFGFSLCFSYTNAQNLQSFILEKNITTFVALPTDSQYLDIIANEIDTITKKTIFDSDVLFWNAKLCMFNTANDTALIVSKNETKHIAILKSVNWRKKGDTNFLKYFTNH